MGKKTESAIDYYVLFRDAEASPCQAEQLLIGDTALYVWGYVGTLNSSQAGAVQDSFYSGLRRRFEWRRSECRQERYNHRTFENNKQAYRKGYFGQQERF